MKLIMCFLFYGFLLCMLYIPKLSLLKCVGYLDSELEYSYSFFLVSRYTVDFFGDEVSLCISGWAETCWVDRTGLRLPEICLVLGFKPFLTMSCYV